MGTGVSLDTLRAAVATKTSTWTGENGKLTTAIGVVADAEVAWNDAVKVLADATLACQVAAYDKYRETLDTAIGTRDANLAKIKTYLEGQTTPTEGIGARCEKAISNGTMRPKRADSPKICGEGNCCGAARIWMMSGVTAEASWRTIETCAVLGTTKYNYVAPRKPMDLKNPDAVSVDFACIEGAKTLAAAASAIAAAVYMLA